MTTFSDTDILDAMMRAAFEPKEIPQVSIDYDGRPQVGYVPSPALIQPLIDLVKSKMESDEVFRALLVAKIVERIDDIAGAVVEKIGQTNSAFGIARVNQGGYHSTHPKWELADWLKEPLGQEMAKALEPALTEHFASGEQGVNLDNAKLNITVEVVPWPKKEEA